MERKERNKVVLSGRLTDNPVLRRTQAGRPVCSVRIAHHPTGSTTAYYDVAAWDDTAKDLAALKRGTLITVTGKLNIRSWQDSSGRERSAVEVKIKNLKVEATPAPRPKFDGMRYAPKLDRSYAIPDDNGGDDG